MRRGQSACRSHVQLRCPASLPQPRRQHTKQLTHRSRASGGFHSSDDDGSDKQKRDRYRKSKGNKQYSIHELIWRGQRVNPTSEPVSARAENTTRPLVLPAPGWPGALHHLLHMRSPCPCRGGSPDPPGSLRGPVDCVGSRPVTRLLVIKPALYYNGGRGYKAGEGRTGSVGLLDANCYIQNEQTTRSYCAAQGAIFNILG